MNAIGLLIVATTSSYVPAQDMTYRITKIDRKEVFAGRLEKLVRETITIEAGGRTYSVQIDGAYHTSHVRKSQRLTVGDRIRLKGRSNPLDGRVRREDISFA